MGERGLSSWLQPVECCHLRWLHTTDALPKRRRRIHHAVPTKAECIEACGRADNFPSPIRSIKLIRSLSVSAAKFFRGRDFQWCDEVRLKGST